MAMEEKKWSYDELQAYVREENAEKAEKAKDVVLPDHWPPNVKPDKGKKAPWLPAGWGQGFKESMNLNFHKVFISPEGKLYFNKRDIEKFLGMSLVDESPPPQENKPVPPRKDWPEWLPTDWFLSQKMSADRYRIYFYSPSGKGFFNRAQAEDFITKNPSPQASPKAKAEQEAKPKEARGASSPGESKGSRRSTSKSRESAKDTAAKSEAAKDTAAKAEAAKDTAAKSEAAKDTAAKAEAAKDTAAKAEAAKDTAAKAEAAKDTAAKAEPAKDTAAKAEKAEPAKDTAAKVEPAKETAAKPEPSLADSADGQQTSPRKRQRLDEASTDDEVAQIEDGSEGDGYSIRECRKGAAWLVLPEDVLSLDLLALSVEVEGAGWSCSERGLRRCNFSGSPDLVLYDSGKLLVRSGEAEARRIAKQYVESWLLLDVPTEAMQV